MLPCCLFMTEKSIAEESKKCSNETAKYTHNTFVNKDKNNIRIRPRENLKDITRIKTK